MDLGTGLPGCHIVGLPDAGVKEGRIRIRGALENTGFKLPPRRITVNLAPADLRKDGAAFDLPIAVGILEAAGVLPEGCARDAVFVGELALDGAVRPVRGVLPMAAWARKRGIARLFVPRENAPEAAVAGGDTRVFPVGRLEELASALQGGARLEPGRWRARATAARREGGPDLRDVRGQEVARRALEIAAAGGHNLLFSGQPGAGKTLLARRLPGILPPLSFDEALETTMVYSVAGHARRALPDPRAAVPRAPPHRHRPSGLAGGGPMVRPGEISLAHNGVLFLDELLEFPRAGARDAAPAARGAQHRGGARPPHRGLPRELHAGGARSTPAPAATSAAGAAPAPARSSASAPTGPSCRGRCSTASTCTSRCRR